MKILLIILLGFTAGTLSGVLGIGGGIILIPALTLFLGYSQHMAQGTTLAIMIPPIGILAAVVYYRHGFVDMKVAGLICIGFVFGGLLGSELVQSVNGNILRKIFAALMIITAIKLWFTK